MAVLVDDLLKNVLINANSSDRIVIITGYFSPDIIDKIAELGKPFEYYYGMYGVDKIRPSVLSALRNINAKYSNLKISFVNTQRVHTKCYLFYDSNNMFNAMVGSANCSMQGLCSMANAEMLAELNLSFFKKEGRILIKLNDYYKKIKKNSIDTNDPLVKVAKNKKVKTIKSPRGFLPLTSDPLTAIMPLYYFDKERKDVHILVVDQTGETRTDIQERNVKLWKLIFRFSLLIWTIIHCFLNHILLRELQMEERRLECQIQLL